MPEPPPLASRCPNCGAELGNPPASRCAACGWWENAASVRRDLKFDDGGPNPYAAPAATAGPAPSLHLATFMALVGLTALLMGVTVQEPVTGGVLWVITVPAVVRTAVAVQRPRLRRSVHPARVFGLFFGSWAISALTVLAAFLTFCVTCFPIGLVTAGSGAFPVGLVLACLLGLAAAGFVVYKLARNLWPIRDRSTEVVFLDEKDVELDDGGRSFPR